MHFDGTMMGKRYRSLLFLLLLCAVAAGRSIVYSQNLVSPVNAARHQNSRGVFLRWTGSASAFSVSFGSDSTSLNVVQSSIDSTSFFLDLSSSPIGTYYWQVAGLSNDTVTSQSPIWSFTTDTAVMLRLTKFIPSENPLTFDTENDSKTDTVQYSLQLNRTAIFLIDVWQSQVNNGLAMSNIPYLIQFGRKYNIPIVHLPHGEAEATFAQPLPGEPVLQDASPSEIDNWMVANNIKNVFYAGEDASECFLFTRQCSMENMKQRHDDSLTLIGVEDCAYSWYTPLYQWCITTVQTIAQTTTLGSMYSAFGDSVNAVPMSSPFAYLTNTFYTLPNDSKQNDALVILNPKGQDPNDGWLQRMKNNSVKIKSLKRLADFNNWTTIYLIDDSTKIDTSYDRRNSLLFSDSAAFTAYLTAAKFNRVLVAGNFAPAASLFSSANPWNLTRQLPVLRANMVNDCVIHFESPSSLPTQVFQNAFINKAGEYGNVDGRNKVTTYASIDSVYNHIPVIASSPIFTAHQDSLYQYQIIANDPDTLRGQVLTYTFTQTPSWLTLSPGGLISGMPRAGNIGDSTVTVQVNDGHGGIVTQSFVLSTLHTNHPPIFQSLPDSVVTEDSMYVYRAYATDQDSAMFGDRVHYRLSIKPSWLTIDSIAGKISGLPSGMNARDTIVAVQATDNKGGVATQQFSLHVIHVNHPPRILSQPVANGHEDSLYVYRCYATDQDSALYGDRVTYTLTAHPYWMAIDTVLGTVSGTPHAVNVGDTVVTVQASDGKGGIATQSYPLHVAHTNHAPVIRTTSLPSAVEDTLYQTRVYASDQDSALFGDVVHYKLTIKPVWLTIDSVSGIVSGTASGMNAQDTVVTVTAYDGKGGISSGSYPVHIIHTNHAPVIKTTSLPSASEDTLYQARVYASDQDSALWGDRVHYHLTAHPYWMAIDTVLGTVSGTPHAVNVGDTVVTVQASDGKGGIATQSYPLHVAHTNHAPVIRTTSLPSAVEDTLYQTRVYASDQDSALFGDVVHYKLTIKPVWLTIDSVSGIVSGTASGMNAQDTVVTVTAYDGKGGISSGSYPVHIIHTNHAPVIKTTSLPSASEDTLYQARVYASDQDSALWGDRVHYHLTAHPYWMAIDTVLGTVSGTPHAVNVGDTVVTVQASDGKGGIATQSYPLHVAHTNHAPVIRTTSLPSAVEDTLYQTRVYASDQDSALFGDVVHYKLTIKPVWLTIDSVSGIVSGTASGMNAQDTVVTVTAYDGKGGISSGSYPVHIIHTNHAPVIKTTSLPSASEDTLYQARVYASDQDSALWGDRVHYHLTAHPYWMAIDTVLGTVSGTPHAVNVGDTVVTVQASDGKGGIATQSYPLHVAHTNHAPVIRTTSLPSAVEDTLYQTRVYASDQDSALFGDVVHYRLMKPAWLTVDSTSGILSGTPHVQNVYDSVALLQAYDNHGGVSQQQYNLHITIINHFPTLVSSPVFTAHEDTLYQYQVIAHDPDTLIGQVLTYTLTQRPVWLAVSARGMISGIPRGANVGDSTVTIRVSDGSGGLVSQTYRLNVIHTNHNPYFVSAPDSVVSEDSLYLYPVSARDQDSALFGDRVHYRLLIRPSWISFDSVAGILSGIPSGVNARDTVVSIQAYDNNGGASVQHFALHVIHVNHPPQFSVFPADSAVEDSLYFTIAGATDQDSSMWGDKDSFGLLEGPSWLAIDSVKGIIQGIPRLVGNAASAASLSGQSVNAGIQQILIGKKVVKFNTLKQKTKKTQLLGIKGDNVSMDFPVTVAVWDDKGGASEYSYDLTVKHTNHAPVFAAFPDTTATEDSLYISAIRASDIDSAVFGDVVRYRAPSKPHWISIDSVSGMLSGTPHGADVVDTTKIVVQAYDGKGGVTSYQFGIHIMHVNHPPVFVSAPIASGVEDSLYVYRAYTTDADSLLWGDKVQYTLVAAPGFLSIDSASGILGGIPSLVVDSLSMKAARAPAGRQRSTIVKRIPAVKFIPAAAHAQKRNPLGVRDGIDSTQVQNVSGQHLGK